MKKVIFLLAVMFALTATAQNKGRFEVYSFDNFKLHVYYTNDAMGDAGYIVEGQKALVTLEEPLFKDNVSEFDAYLQKLNKPVEQRITDYHLGGTGSEAVIMAKGMPAFVKVGVYGDMMQGFAQAFGDAIVPLPTGQATEVDFGSTQTYAGVSFQFTHGASTDFPAASILIGGKAYFTHWAPAKAHVSHLHISSIEAIDAQVAALQESLQSGAEVFIGGHGGAAKADAVEFKIAYLKKMKELVKANTTADAFVTALKKAYPNLPGEEGLTELGKAMYN